MNPFCFVNLMPINGISDQMQFLEPSYYFCAIKITFDSQICTSNMIAVMSADLSSHVLGNDCNLSLRLLSCCVPSTLLASASHPFCCSFSAPYLGLWPQLLGCFVIIVSPTGECQSVWSTQTSCLSESLRRAATAACINCLTS